MNKNASVISILVVLVMITGLAVVMPLIYTVYDAGYETLQNMSGTTEEVTNNTLADFTSAMSGGLLDQAFLVLFVMLTLAMIVLAYVSEDALPFLIIYLILSIVFVIISIPMSNVYQELMASAQFSAIPSGAFTMTTNIMSNLPAVITIISAIVSIVLFARYRSNTGGTYF